MFSTLCLVVYGCTCAHSLIGGGGHFAMAWDLDRINAKLCWLGGTLQSKQRIQGTSMTKKGSF